MPRKFFPLVCHALLWVALASCGRKGADKPMVEVPAGQQGVLILGEVILRSSVPDPAKSVYPDCLFTCEVRVHSHGVATTVPERIVVALPGFAARKLEPAASVRVGDLVKLRIMAAQEAPEKLQMMQRSDQLDDFSLPVYYALTYEAASSAESVAERSWSPSVPDKTASASSPLANAAAVRYPWSAKAAVCREADIHADADFLRDALKRHGGGWDEWQQSLVPLQEDLRKQQRSAAAGDAGGMRKGTFFFDSLRPDLYEKLCQSTDKNEGPGPVLIELTRQLRERGIDLIVVPFPRKEETDADVFSQLAPADGIFEPYRQKFILKMLDAGVEVLDLMPALRAARKKYPMIFYDVGDDHPADGAVQVAAEVIGERLSRYDLEHRPGFVPVVYKIGPVDFETNHHASKKPMRHYTATQVFTPDGTPLLVRSSSSCPVLVAGDSYTYAPGSYDVGAASIPTHLARHLGEPPNVLRRMGGAPEIMQVIASEGGEFLVGRCAVVFIFSPNALVEVERWKACELPPLPAAGKQE